MEAEFYKMLENKLKTLKRRTKLFNLLKNELSRQGYWKNKARRIPARDELKKNIQKTYTDL